MNKLDYKKKMSYVMTNYATVITLVLVFIFFTVTTEDFRFIKIENLLNILRQISILSIVAIGVTVAMAVGEFDMSTGSVIGLSGVLALGLISEQKLAPGVVMLIILLVGLFIGAVNAFITTKLKIPSIIVTLGMMSIVNGLLYLYSGGKSLYGVVPEIYILIGQESLFGIPSLVIIMLFFILVAYFILNKTIVGRYIYATGGSEKTARLSGISTIKYKYLGLMVSAAFAAIAGLLLAARLGSGQPTAGESYTMTAISAVFIGMTTIKVGRANIIGTIVGVTLLGVVSNGLNLLGWPYYMQDMAKGAIMIGAVAFAASKSELKFFK